MATLLNYGQKIEEFFVSELSFVYHSIENNNVSQIVTFNNSCRSVASLCA